MVVAISLFYKNHEAKIIGHIVAIPLNSSGAKFKLHYFGKMDADEKCAKVVVTPLNRAKFELGSGYIFFLRPKNVS